MSSTRDRWGGPSWAFQDKEDAFYDLSGGSTLDSSGNLDLGGTLDVTGAVTFDSTLAVTGASTLTGVVTFSAEPIIAIDSAATNTVVDAATFRVTSTGTPAAGLGVGLVFELENDTPATHEAARIEVDWATETAGSEDSDIRFDVYDGGSKITALSLIGADAGAATFNGEITANAGVNHGSPNVVRKSATVSVSSAELKGLAASPKTLVADPAAGVILLFRYAVISYIAGATGYTVQADEDLMIEYSGGTDVAVVCLADNNTGGIDFTGTTSKRAFVPSTWPGDTAAVSQLTDAKGFQLDQVGAGEWDDGDGTVEVFIVYDEIDY